jgi:hypothetical protein
MLAIRWGSLLSAILSEAIAPLINGNVCGLRVCQIGSQLDARPVFGTAYLGAL